LPLYWLSNQFSLVGWNTGSALVAVGLVSSIKGKYIYIFEADTSQTWQQSFISACLGSFLAAIVVVLMARPGAKYHIGL
jgi:NCS1 family nucleobase:cation symporter-1